MPHTTSLASRTLAALAIPAALVALAAPAAAERYHLSHGESFDAEPIGELDDALLVLTHAGKQARLPKDAIASVESGVALPKELEPKLARAKHNYRIDRRRAATKLIDRHARAKAPARAKIEAALDAFPASQLEGPLGRALSVRRNREFALKRLSATKGVHGIRPLVKAVVTSKDKKLREAAHSAALTNDKALTRTYYEQIVGMPTATKRRLRALGRLAGMGDRQAIPGLIYALEQVESEIKATLATAGGLRRVPVNLGSRGGAALNAPIELPEQSTTAVQTKISASSLRQVSGAIRKVLGGLSGVDRANSKSWKVWWDEQPSSFRK